VLGDPSLQQDARFASNPDRLENNDLITSRIEHVFRSLSVDEVAEMLDRVGIANAQMRTPSSLLEHPQLVLRNRWRDIDSPGGVIRALLPPVTVFGQEPVMGAVPTLGMHNNQLRREFGNSQHSTLTC
jgi:crotonobetainyl-CoA:carnitine CoA-transferase CaiB-like acyl-CoA transferase